MANSSVSSLAQSTSRTLKPGSTLKLRKVLRVAISNTVTCVSLPSFAAQASRVPAGLMVDPGDRFDLPICLDGWRRRREIADTTQVHHSAAHGAIALFTDRLPG